MSQQITEAFVQQFADNFRHEWGLSAGVLLVGSLKGLGFVRELVGL